MRTRKNLLEWTVFTISLVLVAAVFATLIVAGLRSDDAPPSIVVETGPPERSATGFQVSVRARNEGSETAEEVRIEVELLDGDTTLERAETTIPFLPKDSSRAGWVVFRRDPSCCRIEARAAGYNRP
jgi:uncharacterized protein (TIGR02588 family)